jgi:hypothetical protein
MLFDANGRSAGSPQQVDLSRAVQINVPPRGLAVLMAERS